MKGSKDATVALIEFSDFQCPFCGKFARDLWPQLDAAYVSTGKVVAVFRHLPVEALHPLAGGAANAATCAGRQDRFWDMHDKLFALPSLLDGPNLTAKARELSLDLSRFAACMADTTTTESVASDVRLAKSLSITSTPFFYVGRVSNGLVQATDFIKGYQPKAVYDAAIAKALGRQ